MAHAATLTHGGFNVTARISKLIKRISENRARNAEYHRAFNRIYDELQGLSDDTLQEIGLYRSDIPSYAREHATVS